MNPAVRIKPVEAVIVAILYAIATVVYLWFAVRPSGFSQYLQTLDSVFIAVVMDHVARAPFSSTLQFWDLGIFYPIAKTLCLSEPMITPAILMAPVIFTFGYVIAFNTWIYFCWWSLAMASWYCLRKLGLAALACFWAGFVIAFSPDRAWHLAGHGHLYFVTGVFLCLVSLHQALREDGWRWRIIFSISFLLQIFAGIYITAIVAAWAVFVIPAVILQSAVEQKTPLLTLLKTRGKFLVLPIVLGTLLYLPVIITYSSFSEGRYENPLFQLMRASASWKGYVIPTFAPDRIEVLTASLLKDVLSIPNGGEDNQYLGAIPMLLLALFVPLYLWVVFRRRSARLSIILTAGLLAGGITCLFLSFGPYTENQETRLPFAFLYGWLPSIRFFRAPARFAYGVHWSVAILAAWTLSYLVCQLRDKKLPHLGTALGVICIGLTAADFYPVNDLYRIPAGKVPELAGYHLESGDTEPYVPLPISATNTLMRLGWDHVPTADGYSGYFPADRKQELALFEKLFPADEALAIMKSWDVSRVYVTQSQRGLLYRLTRDRRFQQIHSGTEGTLFEVTTSAQTLQEISHQRKQQHNTHKDTDTSLLLMEDGTPTPQLSEAGIEVQYYHMKPAADNELICNPIFANPASLVFKFTKEPLHSSHYDCLTIRYRINNWYSLREPGALYFKESQNSPFTEANKVQFTIHADGQIHEVTIPLHQSFAWVLAKPISQMRIDIGARPNDQLMLYSAFLH